MPHVHDNLDFCSEVFIVFNNKVLLRKHDKAKIWLSVGGHIEHGEDLTQAAIREVKEEVGLDIELFNEDDFSFIKNKKEQLLIRPQYISRHQIIPTHEHVAFIFFARSKTDKLNLSETEKSEEIKWFTKEDLELNKEGVSDAVKFCALKALEKIKD